MTEFLLELGRGFSFVANQQRLKIGSEYYYPDLVFYNRLAKCFVIIDLKLGKLSHQDIGQMQMYVNYYKKTQMIDGENEPIGILLCADKDNFISSKINSYNLEWINKFKKIGGIEQLDRNIVDSFIENIYVGNDKDVEIVFRFKDQYKVALEYLKNQKNVL